MRINRLIVPLTAAVISAVPLSEAAYAELLIKVDKSTQRMTVTVNGVQLYNWPVTTGGSGYDTPGGAFKPFRMEIDHYSDEYDNAPMPYSIFFTQTGNAIHGTYEQRNLGRAVSHGCVRLSVKNAATLWNLVKQEKTQREHQEQPGEREGEDFQRPQSAKSTSDLRRPLFGRLALATRSTCSSETVSG